MSTRSGAFPACWALCGIFAGIHGVHADGDQVFADGFDGPKWYVDADTDAYGNPAVFVHSPSQPPGYVANALDCDDTSPAIHPGATDDPDASFADSNCDGIDGDIAKAVFVAPPGTDSPTCGTQLSPCHSPAFAIGRLSAQRTQIYLQVGVYSGALTVSANAALYGGYGVSWQRGPVTAGGPNAKLVGSITAMGAHAAQAHAVYVPVGIQALLADLEIDGPDTTATSNGNGANSYAVYADQNANLQLLRDRIVAGRLQVGALEAMASMPARLRLRRAARAAPAWNTTVLATRRPMDLAPAHRPIPAQADAASQPVRVATAARWIRSATSRVAATFPVAIAPQRRGCLELMRPWSLARWEKAGAGAVEADPAVQHKGALPAI